MPLRPVLLAASLLALLAAVPTGSVYVTTLPSGADVWLDGTYVGHSPLVLDAVPAGRHTVGLTMTGWSSHQTDVSVDGGQMAYASTRLDRLAGVRAPGGSLAVHAVGLTTLLIDGERVAPGKDGTFALPAGSHVLAARIAGARVTRNIGIWPGTRTDVVLAGDGADQPAAAEKPGVVAPAENYVPASAIRLDGERIGITFNGHQLEAHTGSSTYRIDGRTVDADAAPTMIGTRLYLPVTVLSVFSVNEHK
jgi:hypothetical protein